MQSVPEVVPIAQLTVKAQQPMRVDIVAAKRRLRQLMFLNVAAWFGTLVTLAVPLFQWAALGNVPVDRTFFLLTTLNVFFLVASAMIAVRIKFISYQVRYFSTHLEHSHNG